MKITVVCDVLGALNNGTTIVALDLIKAMQARGHDVRVICPDASKKGLDCYYVVPCLNFGPFQKIVPASFSAAWISGTVLRTWSRDASSGTTPP